MKLSDYTTDELAYLLEVIPIVSSGGSVITCTQNPDPDRCEAVDIFMLKEEIEKEIERRKKDEH